MNANLRSTIWNGLLVGLLCLPVSSRAESGESAPYPTLEKTCVNDHGGLVNKGSRSAIQQLCKRADKDGVKMMVVTIESLEAIDPKPLSLDSLVDELFDDWDIEYTDRANAVLLFVAKKEHQIRVRLGDEYGDKAWKKAVSIMKQTVGPSLRRQASSGIKSGFSRLYRELAVPRIAAIKRAAYEASRKRGTVNFE